jgi:hypothetical protein
MCGSKLTYERRKPEQTLLYQTVAGHLETFKAEREIEGRTVPKYIAEEFENYLRCGILSYGFGRVQCPQCQHEKLVAFSCKGRGFCPSCGARRMAEASIYLTDELVPLVPVRQFVVTFPPPLRLWLARSNALAGVVCGKIMDALTGHLRRESDNPSGLAGAVVFVQRFGSGANLNVHLHIIAIDGTYAEKSTGRLKFCNAKAPTEETTKRLAADIAKRINKHLVKKGFLEEHEDLMLVGNTEDLFAANADDLHLPAQAASAAHRIAFGENAGKPVRRLRSSQTLWPSEDDVEVSSTACINVGGYSVHAATAVKSDERDRLEKLVRYMARPAISEERISILPNGDIKLKLKTPWRDGSEYLIFSPIEFLERLLALIPLPRFHLTRYYGVFAPASPHRKHLPDRPRPKEENNGENADAGASVPQKSKLSRNGKGKQRMGWAALLKRTFEIDVLRCSSCSGRMKLVAMAVSGDAIRETLVGIGVSPRPPPIAPAKLRGLFAYDDFGDFPPERSENTESFADW